MATIAIYHNCSIYINCSLVIVFRLLVIILFEFEFEFIMLSRSILERFVIVMYPFPSPFSTVCYSVSYYFVNNRGWVIYRGWVSCRRNILGHFSGPI